MEGGRLSGSAQRQAPRAAHILLWTSTALFLSALLMKSIGVGLMEFAFPGGNSIYLLRTFFSFSVSGMFVAGVVMTNRSRLQKTAKLSSQTSVWAVLTLSVLFSLVHDYSPQTFIDWASGDGLVETLAALISIMAGLVFALVFIQLLRTGAGPLSLNLGGAATISLLLLAAGIEQINHFDAAMTNVVFHAIAFLLLIIAPFLDDQTSLFGKVEPLRFFIPGLTVLFIGSVSFFYSYRLWDSLFLQLSLFTTLFILAYYAVYARGSLRMLVLALACLGVATQLLLLSNGYSPGVHWPGSAYREFFISIGFLVYSLELLRRTRYAAGVSG